MKKRLASLALTLVLCLSWSAAVFAEGNTIYLRYKPGTNGTYSVEKTEDAGDSGMSISGDMNITGVAANNPDEQNASQPKFLPYCVSSGPVTLTLMRDSEAIAESRIDAVLVASGGYTVTEEEPLRFEGATATISAPGVYHVEVRTADYSLGAQAIIEIIEGAVSSEPTSSPSTGFTDVAADSPFAEAIKWAVEKKITNGKTATTFGPGDTCTVSHILTFLYRAEKGAGSGNERAAVTAWANGLGIDTSNLSAPCTRAMAVTYMWIATGSPAPSKAASFTDVDADAEYAQAVAWAVEKGVTTGTSATAFSPDKTCTRGQIVTFLFRASK